jgi:tRNA nucleotidyltransferase/poly(A) polymerase
MASKQSENDDLSAYAGRWVAQIGSRVIGQGGTPGQALQAAKASCFKDTPVVSYVATQNPLAIPPLVEQIRKILPPGMPVYLVGGAVRDMLLGRETHDLDFVVPHDSFSIGRQIANALKGAFYPLDEERQTARVILANPDGTRRILDVALQRYPNLESDLAGRDFTVNAIAIDIWKPTALLDPLGGAADLLAKKIRACSDSTFVDDPVRVLRGIRLAAELKFNLIPKTRRQMRESVPKLTQVSPERLRDELFRILDGPQPATVLRALDILGALPYILPEVEQMKGVEQPPPHTADVYTHSLEVLQRLETLLDVLASHHNREIAENFIMGLVSMHLGRYREQLDQHLHISLNPNRTLRGLLFFAALYHDAGKCETRQVDHAGRIRFIGHEAVGADLVTRRGQLLNLSNVEINRLVKIVLHHMRPLSLAHYSKPPSSRAVYRFFRVTGTAGVDICLLSLADALATYGTALTEEVWANHLDVIRILLEAWWEHPEKSVAPPPIVNGSDLLKECNLSPGPLVGKLLETIREAQVSGRVKTRQEAIELANSVLAGKRKM